jgi:hypothetical protein
MGAYDGCVCGLLLRGAELRVFPTQPYVSETRASDLELKVWYRHEFARRRPSNCCSKAAEKT